MSHKICKYCEHIRTNTSCTLTENNVMVFGDSTIYCKLTNKTIKNPAIETCADFELMECCP